jgi:hypothetical protein
LEDLGYYRSVKSIEYKLQNVSGVLKALGRDWISGLAPLKGYQAGLKFLVEERLGVSAGQGPHAGQASKNSLPKIDWAERDEKNRALGLAGEHYILEFERQRLRGLGRLDLATKIRHVSIESDAHGYDVLSFSETGSPLLVEVKTTTGPTDIPFFLTANELKVAEENRSHFAVYRVSGFPKTPQVNIFPAPLAHAFDLQPALYRVSRKRG